MKNTSLICLFLFPFIAPAQNKSIDSLRHLLKTLPLNAKRVNVLNDISSGFIKINQYDSAFRYAMPAMQLSNKLHYPVGVYFSNHHLAEFFLNKKDYVVGKFFLFKSLNAALLTHNKKNIAGNYEELSEVFKKQAHTELALENHNKFLLYQDSAAKEESAGHATEIKALPDSARQQKVGLVADGAKDTAASEKQKQMIFYISLIVLALLSVLIIWLIIARSKQKATRKAALLKEDAADELGSLIENETGYKNDNTKKLFFLQKIREKVVLSGVQNNEEKQPQIDIASSIAPIFEEKSIVVKSEVKEKEIENEIITVEEARQPIEQVAITFENKTGDNVISEKKTTAPVYFVGKYSNIIFSSQLLHFAAKLANDKILLTWKTQDESKVAYFGVEKSVDAAQFIIIETIAAKGLSGNNYETFDFKPLPGINYYRLEIIDTDGNFIYGPILQVEVLPTTTLSLISYPLHVKDVMIVAAAGGILPVLVNIYDTMGKKYFSIEVPSTATPIYLSSLGVGKYTLQMKCQGKTVLQQLIKL